MKTITQFLLERIAEDESVALGAEHDTVRRWEYGQGQQNVWNGHGRSACSLAGPRNGPHIARHDPARVLAECAAKRAIIELHADYILTDDEPGFSMTMWECMCQRQTLKPCPTISTLAAVYADHPDYLPEWAL